MNEAQLTEALQRNFGHPAFRPGQLEAVEAVVGSRDVLLVMPTGAGKSLGYQLPAEAWVNPFLQNLNLICFAESLGGVESFTTSPATQTHADILEEIRNETGVDNRLLRFSVGIEDAQDIIDDLTKALATAKKEVITND